jgi:tetratricopeptide (TPR) repeat protein/mono/diheme cytochrome c family protein
MLNTSRILVAFASLTALLATGKIVPSLAATAPANDNKSQAGVTFNKQIAPIVFEHCSSCHRPGQPGPFSLLEYQDLAKRTKQILQVVTTRKMPPWLPAPGLVEFEHERRLSEGEIKLFERWIESGAGEGNAADLPSKPVFSDEWALGKPDLIVQMPEPYALAAEGKDTYRNFVVPLPFTNTQYVAAYEFRPGNTRAVHHAFLTIDRSGEARKKDAQDQELGFPGLHMSLKLEPTYGFFISWQPGKVPSRYRDGMAWPLLPGSDLVLQLHLQHTGKPETIQPSIGFYFTDKPASKLPSKICIRSLEMDIPAGQKQYETSESFKLPADVDLIGILPHAHYLAKKMEAFAILPNGLRQWLLLINDWDFNWQGDYSYKVPIFLPKGSTIQMRYTYDNSAENPHNPTVPPKRVTYGLQSTDEMAELWLQMLPRTPADAEALNRAYSLRIARQAIISNERILRENPRDAIAWLELGKDKVHLGQITNALPCFKKSLELQPTPEAHYHLGLALELIKADYPARQQYEAALALNPKYFRARNNLGLLFLKYGDFATAETHFREILSQNPEDTLAQKNMELTRKLAREHLK